MVELSQKLRQFGSSDYTRREDKDRRINEQRMENRRTDRGRRCSAACIGHWETKILDVKVDYGYNKTICLLTRLGLGLGLTLTLKP